MKSYVCVLATDNFLEGVLVLNHNLKVLNSKYPLLCLVSDTISDKSKRILDYFKIQYKVVSTIEYHSNNYYTRWNHTFDKFNIFNLTEYEKIVYLDSDFIILKNLDHLFKIDKFTMNSDLPYNSDHYNSSIIITKPNINDYNGLLSLLKEYDKNKRDAIGDQNVINEYFKNINSLDSSYNVMRAISYNKEMQYDKYLDRNINKHLVDIMTKNVKDPIVIHYIGYIKPFMINGLYIDEYSTLYQEYLKAVREILNTINE